ncbi:glucosamine-6-phosphate isomerase, partial [bacterium]|nr:glucosamine-6-phosphate isomerase [bacterium]
MDLISTIKGSMMEGFFPAGWDLKKIDECAGQDPAAVLERQEWWHEAFSPVPCQTLEEFDVKMGHEIAVQIGKTRQEGKEVIFILPVGPMGMYKWAVYFLKEWGLA